MGGGCYIQMYKIYVFPVRSNFSMFDYSIVQNNAIFIDRFKLNCLITNSKPLGTKKALKQKHFFFFVMNTMPAAGYAHLGARTQWRSYQISTVHEM